MNTIQATRYFNWKTDILEGAGFALASGFLLLHSEPLELIFPPLFRWTVPILPLLSWRKGSVTDRISTTLGVLAAILVLNASAFPHRAAALWLAFALGISIMALGFQSRRDPRTDRGGVAGRDFLIVTLLVLLAMLALLGPPLPFELD